MRTALITVLLTGCGSPDPDPGDPLDPTLPATPTPPTSSTTPTPTGPDPSDALALPPLMGVANGRFATSDACTDCHSAAPGATALKDAAGRSVGPSDLWPGSMMANSARDPIWRAVVAAEVAATPAAAALIEAKCMRCHAPMASEDAVLDGDAEPVTALLESGTERGHLGLDGVSCTLCHQIEDRELGDETSFTGGFEVLGNGTIYGPHDDVFAQPMERRSGFTPVAGPQLADPGLCATCHTLETPALAPDGTPTGSSVLEQAAYLEWQASTFSAPGAEGATCAECHLPRTDEDGNPIVTRIARNPGGSDFPSVPERSPFGRHLLVGGNTLAPALLRDNAALLNPVGDAAAFDATIAAARAQLEQATASVAIDEVVRTADALRFVVRLANHAGHKLPTGIPLRRAWLHVTITGASGVVFESGAFDERGRIVGPDGVMAFEELGGPIAPHVREVVDPGTVPVFEGVLADDAGAPTFRLLRGAGWYKDDRLLPEGYRLADADPRTHPVGVEGDDDFDGGGDTVAYTVDLAGASGPLTIVAEALFQPLSARWRAELAATATPEAIALERMLEEAGLAPERLDRSEVVAP